MDEYIADRTHDTIDTIDHFDVLVIGNGPSAIVLSYLLTGYWPYYEGQLHLCADEQMQMLHARLINPDQSETDHVAVPRKSRTTRGKQCRCAGACTGNVSQVNDRTSTVGKLALEAVDTSDSDSNESDHVYLASNHLIENGFAHLSINQNSFNFWNHPTKNKERILQASLVERNLQYLSQGLTGRSNNPISLLFDHLQHPQADTGRELDSTLQWHLNRKCHFTHKVLGKGLPGGAWAKMDNCSDSLTISLGNWMQLADYSIHEWLHNQTSVDVQSDDDDCAEMAGQSSIVQPPHDPPTKRIKLSAMAKYYRDFVHNKNLQDNFENHSNVRNVRYCGNCEKWIVSGRNEISGRKFQYTSDNVVLATGCSERDNRLRVPGENQSFVLHSFEQIEHLLDYCSQMQSSRSAPSGSSSIVSNPCLNNVDPILVVGAGLSAADAILTLLTANIPVVHAFRKHPDDPSLIFNQLPESLYPEYHHVHRLMAGTGVHCESHAYRPLMMHELVHIRSGGEVELRNLIDQPDSADCKALRITVQVRAVICLIGQQPDLSFLRSRRMLAALTQHPELPVDPRTNPLLIDPFTHECARLPHLYAMGPLVGDNFVRFLQGGALAICADLYKKYVHKSKHNRIEHAP